ncbi:hypothetical protein [Nonomuraea rhodomycinica]|uniref:Uncharacterized protein n=1 Tax=Nonomuraea rhodomycinica TaxID=1712872 RepID=A0A7Y6MG96_9ACTN|nr:hypothetical protein [Nonomuraea rhodomycinica]NUW45511.1 hypothetical protein [Nonomuraea rhodomycinica]
MTAQHDTDNHTRWPLWGLLVFCGAISLTLSVMHALSKAAEGDLKATVAGFLIGIAPVIAAAFLAHLLTDPYASNLLKGGVGLVFVGGMALSVNAQQEVVLPFVGGNHFLAVLFPIVLDLSTVMALLALSGVGYSYNRALQLEELRKELEPVLNAELRRNFTAEQAAREEELRAELERAKKTELGELQRELEENHSAELAALRRELAERHSEELDEREQAIRGELADRWEHAVAQIRKEAAAETEDRVRDAEIATEARVRLELTKNSTAGKRRPKEIESASGKGAGQQVNKRARAASILRTNPDIEVKELAAMLDCTTKYARNLIADMAPGRGNGQGETGSEEVRLRAVP